jgi:hypothetical protein
MRCIRCRGRFGTPLRDEVTYEFRFSVLIAVAFMALALWPPSSSAADFTPLLRAPPCDGQCVSAWDLSGEIKPGDDIQLRSLIEARDLIAEDRSGFRWSVIRVFTDGGDVETALKMGRIIRQNDLSVIVSEVGYCRSACAFLLAGAVNRFVYGEVAIHRPYFSQLAQGLIPQQVDSKYKKLVQVISAYVQEMNVPQSLADAMLAIPPGQMKILTRDEIARYMLDQTDPAYDERRTARIAAAYRLDSNEYRRRGAIADSQCETRSKEFDDWWWGVCRTSVLAGLTAAQASRRLAAWKKLKERKDVPSDESAADACEISVIMDGAEQCP